MCTMRKNKTKKVDAECQSGAQGQLVISNEGGTVLGGVQGLYPEDRHDLTYFLTRLL